MSLKDELDKLRAASAERFPPETLATMQGATQELIASGIAEQSASEGSAAPDFSLPNAHGEPVASEALWGDGPAVVSFYRGGWCPYCNIELKALQDRLPEIEALGARLVAITPETPDNALSTQEKNEIGFDVLSDDGNRVASAFGLSFPPARSDRRALQGLRHRPGGLQRRGEPDPAGAGHLRHRQGRQGAQGLRRCGLHHAGRAGRRHRRPEGGGGLDPTRDRRSPC